MTNIDKFFSNAPGVVFLFVCLTALVSAPDSWLVVKPELERLLIADRAEILSVTALAIVVLGFVSVATSIVVGRIWDAIFYAIFGGYDQNEYEYARLAVQKKLKSESDVAKFVRGLRIQPLYGTLLHSFAPSSYIEWLGRRWTSFNNAGLQATASILGMLSATILSSTLAFPAPPIWTYVFFGVIFPSVTWFVGRARLKEVLSSEELFCRSLSDKELDNAMSDIARKISKRQTSDNENPKLGDHL